MTSPFRFAATLPAPTPPLPVWRDSLRRLEDLGIDTLVAADHFTQGYAAEPMVALTAAVGATTSARLQTGVLGNDYRHPVLVHRMAALLDLVSEGRFVLGLGAGWMTTDYEAAGIPLDEPGVRVDRFEESIRVVKGLFGDEPFTFDGAHYQIHALDGLPKPMQRPHPPFFLGGGSPRVLRIAGREADVVGVNASLRAGELGNHAIRDLSCERVQQKVGWVHEGATAAGREADSFELEMNHWLARVTATAVEADEHLARVGERVTASSRRSWRSRPAFLSGRSSSASARCRRAATASVSACSSWTRASRTPGSTTSVRSSRRSAAPEQQLLACNGCAVERSLGVRARGNDIEAPHAGFDVGKQRLGDVVGRATWRRALEAFERDAVEPLHRRREMRTRASRESPKPHHTSSS